MPPSWIHAKQINQSTHCISSTRNKTSTRNLRRNYVGRQVKGFGISSPFFSLAMLSSLSMARTSEQSTHAHAFVRLGGYATPADSEKKLLVNWHFRYYSVWRYQTPIYPLLNNTYSNWVACDHTFFKHSTLGITSYTCWWR